MKINNFKYIILALVTWGLQGCDHFLDIKPKGYTIPEYFDDYEKLMSSDDFNFSGEVYTNFMTDDIHLADKTVSRELSTITKAMMRKNFTLLLTDRSSRPVQPTVSGTDVIPVFSLSMPSSTTSSKCPTVKKVTGNG